MNKIIRLLLVYGVLRQEDKDGTVLICYLLDNSEAKQLRRYAMADGALVWESAPVTVTSPERSNDNEQNNIRKSLWLLAGVNYDEGIAEMAAQGEPVGGTPSAHGRVAGNSGGHFGNRR